MNEKRYCTKCGKELPDGAVFCPYCAEPVFNSGEQKQYSQNFGGENTSGTYYEPPVKANKTNKGKKTVGIIIAVIGVILLTVGVTSALSGNTSDTSQSTSVAKIEESSSEETEKAAEKATASEEKLVDNEYVTVRFIQWYDMDEITDAAGVPTIYLQLEVKNKCGKEIYYSLEDVSINGEMIPNSASTYDIEANKSSSYPSTLFTAHTAVEGIKAEDIEEIEFTFRAFDPETLEELGNATKCTVYKK